MNPADWFLTAAERGNPATRLDSRHGDGTAWTAGNEVTPLVHGSAYFAELEQRVGAMESGDLLLFTDWRGDPDERLRPGGPSVSAAFGAAAGRGVRVAGLVWRSHLDRLAFSADENRHLGEDIEAAGGQCLLDMRVRPGGSHHMKLAVLRHPGRPERDVAFVGGIDLCHSRRDDARHLGDEQSQAMAAVYGQRPPWHDVQAMIRGPAVGDVETVFRERWEDPAPLSGNPLRLLRDVLAREQVTARPLPAQLPDPAPCGTRLVQLLRTYPYRKRGYDFAPDGERSIARAYLKALPQARSLVYIEDQYLWSAEVVRALAAALRGQPRLKVAVILPRFPDQDGRLSVPLNLAGRVAAQQALRAAGQDRVAWYGLENGEGTPVYVHAKVCLVDDTWAVVGSDNFNRRSWTHDSELSCAIMDETAGSESVAERLRRQFVAEHLGVDTASAPGLEGTFSALAESAARLDGWHTGGCVGARPAGQLRRYPDLAFSPWQRAWTAVPYRLIYDPDGRPPSMRRAGAF